MNPTPGWFRPPVPELVEGRAKHASGGLTFAVAAAGRTHQRESLRHPDAATKRTTLGKAGGPAHASARAALRGRSHAGGRRTPGRLCGGHIRGSWCCASEFGLRRRLPRTSRGLNECYRSPRDVLDARHRRGPVMMGHVIGEDHERGHGDGTPAHDRNDLRHRPFIEAVTPDSGAGDDHDEDADNHPRADLVPSPPASRFAFGAVLVGGAGVTQRASRRRKHVLSRVTIPGVASEPAR